MALSTVIPSSIRRTCSEPTSPSDRNHAGTSRDSSPGSKDISNPRPWDWWREKPSKPSYRAVPSSHFREPHCAAHSAPTSPIPAMPNVSSPCPRTTGSCHRSTSHDQNASEDMPAAHSPSSNGGSSDNAEALFLFSAALTSRSSCGMKGHYDSRGSSMKTILFLLAVAIALPSLANKPDLIIGESGTVAWIRIDEENADHNAVFILRPGQSEPLKFVEEYPADLRVAKDGTVAWVRNYAETDARKDNAVLILQPKTEKPLILREEKVTSLIVSEDGSVVWLRHYGSITQLNAVSVLRPGKTTAREVRCEDPRDLMVSKNGVVAWLNVVENSPEKNAAYVMHPLATEPLIHREEFVRDLMIGEDGTVTWTRHYQDGYSDSNAVFVYQNENREVT